MSNRTPGTRRGAVLGFIVRNAPARMAVPARPTAAPLEKGPGLGNVRRDPRSTHTYPRDMRDPRL